MQAEGLGVSEGQGKKKTKSNEPWFKVSRAPSCVWEKPITFPKRVILLSWVFSRFLFHPRLIRWIAGCLASSME